MDAVYFECEMEGRNLGSKSYLFIYHVLIQQVCIKMTNCNDILYIKTLNKSYPIYIYIAYITGGIF